MTVGNELVALLRLCGDDQLREAVFDKATRLYGAGFVASVRSMIEEEQKRLADKRARLSLRSKKAAATRARMRAARGRA